MAVPVSSASVPAPAPTAAVRLAYVLQHFRLAYPDAPAAAVGHSPAAEGVMVADGGGTFFSETAPVPPPPVWREWQGQSVPFFFDTKPDAPLLETQPGRAIINADIISGAFYLLSGWQEYFSPARDRHGRFPYAASVQQQHGFVALPVVNYYFDVLKTAVEHVTGQRFRPRRWNGAPFAGFVTHDVDNLHGGWGTAARHLAGRGRFGRLLKLLIAKATHRPAPWDNLEHVQAETARFGAPSTFFILGAHRPAPNGTANADYRAAAPAFQQRLRQLAAAGAEIASHASYGTAQNPDKLHRELEQLKSFGPLGNRFHYLCWEPTATPAVVAQSGVLYDSTLGFAEHYGFRNSYCLPFFPFDFARNQAHDYVEIPLNIMDATLHHPGYLQLRPEEILPALRPMLAEIERFGGVATVLWHNENFDPANAANGPQQLRELLAHLQQRGAVFLTGREICQQFTA